MKHFVCPQVAQAHYRNADVTLACEPRCVTNGKRLLTKACMECTRFFLKERTNVIFLNKIAYHIALLNSLLFASVSSVLKRISAS